MDIQAEYMTVEEAAEQLGIKKSAVYDAIAHDRLTPLRLGPRMILLKRSDVAAYTPRSYRDRPGAKASGGRPPKRPVEGSSDE